MLKSTIDNVPDALVKLVPVVQLAATAGCSHTRQEKTDALRAAATVLGAEEYVNSCYSDPKSSPTTRKIARQIISSIHPEPLDWGLVIDIPWGRPSMRSLAVELAENTLSDTLRGKEISRNETLLTRCVGFGRLLRNAQENLVEFGSKGQRLQRCIAQIEDAWRNKDFSVNIDYDFGDMLDDKQGVFDFYE